MSIATRAITSARERLKKALSNLERCRGSEETRAKKQRAVDVARYTLKTLKEAQWIPATTLPEEHDSIFRKLKGTDKWRDGMFERTSDKVLVTLELDPGTRVTVTAHTIDGKWKPDCMVQHKVIAWRPMPEPMKGAKP